MQFAAGLVATSEHNTPVWRAERELEARRWATELNETVTDGGAAQPAVRSRHPQRHAHRLALR